MTATNAFGVLQNDRTMKRITLLFVGIAAFFAATAFALPPLQHRVDGTVQAIEHDGTVLVLLPRTPDRPATFSIKTGRTRFRRDGKRATVGELPIGASVRLYYRQEVGERVATEISWKSAGANRETAVQPNAR